MNKKIKNSPETFSKLPVKERVRLIIENARNDRKLLTKEEVRALCDFEDAEGLKQYNRYISWYNLGNAVFRDTLTEYRVSLFTSTLAAAIFYKEIQSSRLLEEISLALEEAAPEKFDEEDFGHCRHKLAWEAVKLMVAVQKEYDLDNGTITVKLKPQLDQLMKELTSKLYSIIESVLVTVRAMQEMEKEIGLPILFGPGADLVSNLMQDIKRIRKVHNGVFYGLLARDPLSMTDAIKKVAPELNAYIIKWPNDLDSRVQELIACIGGKLGEVQKDLQNAIF